MKRQPTELKKIFVNHILSSLKLQGGFDPEPPSDTKIHRVESPIENGIVFA